MGYLITWKNADIKLKYGSISEGKKISIDGQQRVTALTASILGQKVVNKEYKSVPIRIAFNPIEEKFEVNNPAIEKNSEWISNISNISNISKMFTSELSLLALVREYCEKNEEADMDDIDDMDDIYNKLEKFKNITKKQKGLIELSPELDIETVTEIFIRINSEGVSLSQSDFAMSKIGVNEEYNGNELRKTIDYFCNLIINPESYKTIKENDTKFSITEYFRKISWLKNEKDDLYDPDYNDLLRVVFTSQFHRGKLSDLVELLSGRNFETRTYEEEIVKQSFEKLEKGIMEFVNETNFKRFLMIIRSASFIVPSMITSKNALNFAYIVYLTLRQQKYNHAEIEHYVKRWYVMSLLTKRYFGSPESMYDYDIKRIVNKKFGDYLKEIEDANLSEGYWEHGLIQILNTSVSTSPYFNIFLASQVKLKDKGFLSKDIGISELISLRGDVHHIFPREYLKKHGLPRGDYNQIANYVYTQQEININIGKHRTNEYMKEVKAQCDDGNYRLGGIIDIKIINKNLEKNCIPSNIFDLDIVGYEQFLNDRREMIASKIKEYYYSL